ncbi:MAG TPA: cytochrome c3 family protein, partial [Nitrospirota bacterium]|nr:cytochrome c3 family protein [Nitrospirota bacterium]
ASTLQYEYEICLKCHSDFAWGNNPPPASTGGFGPLTNQALEFGMNSTSFHPVAQATGRTAGVLGGMIGMLWTPIGMNTMFCSDCHTKEGDGMPTGPHGSIFPFNLRNPFTDQYGGRGGGDAQKQQPGDLCFDCHDQNEYWDSTTNGKAMVGTGFYQNGTNVNLHTQHAWRAWNSANNPWPYRCVNCHSRVPHGYYTKAMIVLDTDAPPYVVVPGKMSAYNPMPAGYVQTDCTTVAGCHTP